MIKTKRITQSVGLEVSGKGLAHMCGGCFRPVICVRMRSRGPQLEEVNFWQPGGSSSFKALQRGELFLFKLHSPRNFIVGGGLFGHASLPPLSIAWETFGVLNGVLTHDEMRARIAKYRRDEVDSRADYQIGCRNLGSAVLPAGRSVDSGTHFVGAQHRCRQDLQYG